MALRRAFRRDTSASMSRKLFGLNDAVCQSRGELGRATTRIRAALREKNDYEDARKPARPRARAQSSAPSSNWIERSLAPCFSITRHDLLILLLPRTFTAPSPTPQGEHHHHANHCNPELHAKPNRIQWVHRPPLATGCTPLCWDAHSPVEHFHHECQFGKKRWYLTVSVNGLLTSLETSAFPVEVRRSHVSTMGIATPLVISRINA